MNTRSNPATYTGLLDDIRRLFARANHVSASLFSFNSKGACPDCQGLGYIYTELAFLEPVRMLCEECQGKRFKEEVLRYKLDGKDISEVLAMTVREALSFFQDPAALEKLRLLEEVGLDYLTLGQPLPTLSGGEAQRIKLAAHLHRAGNIYILDEPTAGLHMADTGRLLTLLDRLVAAGNSVVVVEHNLDVIKSADWSIDLGPGAGGDGGALLYAGPPAGLIACQASLTGQCLREEMAGAAR